VLLLLAILPPADALPAGDAGAAAPVAPAATATPSAIVTGERLEWRVSWMGIDAGTAWSTTAAHGVGWLLEAGCTSAGWLRSMYPIDDRLISEWTPGAGSSRYTTRFREGDFQQDQEMSLGADAVVIARSQRFDDGWRSWEDHYRGAPAVEDPVSAFYRLRGEAGPVGERARFTVWTGKKAVPVVAHTAAAEPLDGRPTLRVEVLADEGTADVDPKMTVWISDDDERVPLLAVLRTRAGPVRATLVGRAVP
jgi:hypothetical protein